MKWFKKFEKQGHILEKVEAKDKLKRYFELVIGILLIAIAFNLFLLPNELVFGGVSGLSIIVSKFITIDASTFIMIASLLLLVVSFLVLGKNDTKASIVGSILFPIFVNITANIGEYIKLDTGNVLLSAVFGGIIYGFGAGLVFKAGFTTGGTDIINQILSKYLHMSMGNAMLISDGLIVVLGGFFFGATKLMYALIVIYIITNEDEKIRDYLLNELHHGVTIFSVKGGYTHKKDEVILCVVPTREYYRVKEGIHEIDSEAFFVVCDAYEVSGGE